MTHVVRPVHIVSFSFSLNHSGSGFYKHSDTDTEFKRQIN